jgi:hypothetical protein
MAKIGKFEDTKASSHLDTNVHILRNLCREYHSLVYDKTDIKKNLCSNLYLSYCYYFSMACLLHLSLETINFKNQVEKLLNFTSCSYYLLWIIGS